MMTTTTTTTLVARLCALAGIAAPEDGAVARALARAPRDRLVRALGWYAIESQRGESPALLLTGIRLINRGWNDFYMTSTLAVGAEVVSLEAPGDGRRAFITRHERSGRGWQKDSISSTGEVRPEIELATRWLGRLSGCVLHDDCIAYPELGAACSDAPRSSASD